MKTNTNCENCAFILPLCGEHHCTRFPPVLHPKVDGVAVFPHTELNWSCGEFKNKSQLY